MRLIVFNASDSKAPVVGESDRFGFGTISLDRDRDEYNTTSFSASALTIPPTLLRPYKLGAVIELDDGSYYPLGLLYEITADREDFFQVKWQSFTMMLNNGVVYSSFKFQNKPLSEVYKSISNGVYFPDWCEINLNSIPADRINFSRKFEEGAFALPGELLSVLNERFSINLSPRVSIVDKRVYITFARMASTQVTLTEDNYYDYSLSLNGANSCSKAYAFAQNRLDYQYSGGRYTFTLVKAKALSGEFWSAEGVTREAKNMLRDYDISLSLHIPVSTARMVENASLVTVTKIDTPLDIPSTFKGIPDSIEMSKNKIVLTLKGVFVDEG